MALRTKSITDEKRSYDGVRISVMSCRTDGAINQEIDEWMLMLAPPLTLVEHYCKHGMPWDEFARKYIGYLASPRVQSELRKLAERAKGADVTILCAEKTVDRSHRRLIAEACHALDPTLDVFIS